jgi:hypothetical protein
MLTLEPERRKITAIAEMNPRQQSSPQALKLLVASDIQRRNTLLSSTPAE